ncbi:MAG: hypothetical protein AAB638_01640 [Patescibacteria group bacterium]
METTPDRHTAVSIFTSMEIAREALDLQFHILQSEGRFGYEIARGPSGEYKKLVVSGPAFDSRPRAVANIRGLLRDTVSFVDRSKFTNNLNTRVMEAVHDTLKTNDTAITY